MAVNGVEIAVGQKWLTRGGATVTVIGSGKSTESHPHHVRQADGMEWFVTNAGYLNANRTINDADLVKPAKKNDAKDNAGDFMGVAIKGGITAEPSALAAQVGGTHYKGFAIQPVEYIHANKLGFCEGNVVKYITRHAAKNGADDIRKVIHYCQLLLELQYGVKKEGVL